MIPGMRCPHRVFLLILLLSVVLNLADWPYLDEIFGGVPTGLISEMLGAQPIEKDSPGSAVSKVRMGYQLLVAMPVIPATKSIPLPEPLSDKAPRLASRTLLSVIPSSIDRPPTSSGHV